MAVQSVGTGARIEGEVNAAGVWRQLILYGADSIEICNLERSLIDEEDSLGAEELDEYGDQISDCKPESAVAYLTEYFDKVRCVYSFQVLKGAWIADGWDILDKIREVVFEHAPSIMQADDEGFTNEQGFHILWQFHDDVEGPLEAAVLLEGHWHTFEMDLGNAEHREAFCRGEIVVKN